MRPGATSSSPAITTPTAAGGIGEGNDIPLGTRLSILRQGAHYEVMEIHGQDQTQYYGGVSVAFTDNPEERFLLPKRHSMWVKDV